MNATATTAKGDETSSSGLDASAVLPPPRPTRGLGFWMIFLSLCVCGFLTAIEMGSVSPALPTIIEDLHGTQFIWVGSAYALGATALIPLSGGLAQVFGRRPVVLTSIALFAVGSAVCGAAQNMGMMIAGRAVQGLGGGGIVSVTQIIVGDLVPLRERGMFNGIISMAYAFGVGVGPVTGGGLASLGQWRWLFYLNLPVAGIAGILALVFVRLKTPSGTLREKLGRIDYAGNVLVVGATTSAVLALTWGGIQFGWGSAQVLAPLILGLVGLVAFMVYETFVASNPLVPFDVVSTMTGFSGHTQNFLTWLVLMTLTYYTQVYYQACYDVSPIAAGVNGLPLAIVPAPMGLIAGVITQKRGSFRLPIWIGWVLIVIGTAMMATLDEASARAKAIGFTVIPGTGIGILILMAYFPVLAPIKVEKNAQAVAFFVFLRNFSLVWGVTVGGSILQNQLQRHLPAAFLAQFPPGSEIAYSIIPVIKTLPEPLQTEVRAAFARSLQTVWWATTGIAGLGLLFSLLMKPYPLHTAVDRDWGMEGTQSGRDVEKDATAPVAE
ncbi:unnamed protein product [Mycena citricolor]|uniref:Major facilitator superfamily (MFS) profile domain-containing protein n=1 Tax=Mycena citricolor TaxID=2018698 RepID=A0AAD2I0D9_9AGAR|nr:unnamed protein product [Mycena citricolor]